MKAWFRCSYGIHHTQLWGLAFLGNISKLHNFLPHQEMAHYYMRICWKCSTFNIKSKLRQYSISQQNVFKAREPLSSHAQWIWQNGFYLRWNVFFVMRVFYCYWFMAGWFHLNSSEIRDNWVYCLEMIQGTLQIYMDMDTNKRLLLLDEVLALNWNRKFKQPVLLFVIKWNTSFLPACLGDFKTSSLVDKLNRLEESWEILLLLKKPNK